MDEVEPITITGTSTSTKRMIAVVMVLGGLLACARAPRAPYPHESMMTVIGELKIFLAQDPYRAAPGEDLGGRNIFRVSLERLKALESLGDPQYGDILAFARGECLERLGDWRQARGAFEAAAACGTSLAAPARARAAQAGRLAELLDRSAFAATLEGYLTDLDVLERRLRDWLSERPAWPYDAYARQAIQQTQEERARLLFTNRLVLERAGARALEVAQKLADEHKESWRGAEHWLLLGSYYETLARDWVQQRRPESLDFKLDPVLQGWLEQARAVYRRVAQTDGDPAKPEGQARLRALDAFVLRVQALAH